MESNRERKLLSIIVPCYNEQENIELFYEKISSEVFVNNDIDYELLFVDDGSKDNTYQEIKKVCVKDKKVNGIFLSKNFGKEAAIFAGLNECKGDACVVIDSDLQHPPAVINDMIRLWKDGYDIVEGVKNDRGKEGVVHRFFTTMFYRIISSLVGIDMRNTSDFKLLDRKVIDVLCHLNERNTFFRALSFWVGFSNTQVVYDVQERIAGTTKWSFFSLLRYALKNMISFTYAPLYLIALLGGLMIIIGCGLGIDAIISYIMGETVEGYPTLVLLIVFSAGCIVTCLGIIGIYVAKIYDEVKKRPQFIVRERNH